MTGRFPDFNAAWPKEVIESSNLAAPQTKTVWITVGVAWFIGDPHEGKIKLRIDTVPVGWDGSLVLFPKKKTDPLL